MAKSNPKNTAKKVQANSTLPAPFPTPIPARVPTPNPNPIPCARFDDLASLLHQPAGALYGDGPGPDGTHTKKLYRYILWRTWNPNLPRTGFLLLNPSTATEHVLDPTLTRCQNFAKKWGAGGMVVANIFALRSTNPAALKQIADPIGPDNDAAIAAVLTTCNKIVAGWGNHGSIMARHEQITKLICKLPAHRQSDVVCFAITKSGAPKHPLYIAANTAVMPYATAAD